MSSLLGNYIGVDDPPDEVRQDDEHPGHRHGRWFLLGSGSRSVRGRGDRSRFGFRRAHPGRPSDGLARVPSRSVLG